MSFAPYAALWVLLVVAAVSYVPAGWRSRIQPTVSIAVLLLALALWFFFRPDAIEAALSFAGRRWAIAAAAWTLTGVVLLLAFIAAIQLALDRQSPAAARQSSLSFMLAAAALPSIWAADERTRLLGLAAFAVGWAVAGRFSPLEKEPASLYLTRFVWPILVALLLAWLAAALPTNRFLIGMLASAVLLGVWPLRRLQAGRRPDTTLIPDSFPVVVGGAVLVASLADPGLSPLVLAVGTALGLISAVAGLGFAWSRAGESPAVALRLGLVGLTLVAAIWAGPEALLAGVRLAVFAPVLLVLGAAVVRRAPALDGQPPVMEPVTNSSSRFGFSPGVLAAVAVYLAVAGMPLTVGFVVLFPLYVVWSASSGWVLLVVVALLLALWLATVALNGRSLARAGSVGRGDWLRAAALLPPLAGLISPRISLPDNNWLIWLAIVIPAIASLLLARFMPAPGSLGGLLREAAALPEPMNHVGARLRSASSFVAGAFSDALSILEGEYGLLWLLGLLLLLTWIA